MAKKKAKPRTDAEESTPNPQTPDRDEELGEDKDLTPDLHDLYKDIEKGFENQNERANNIMDYWDVYNCKLSGNQYYAGNSKIFLPIVHDAVKARKTRFTNQIFPSTGRYVEVTTEDGTLPQAEMSLIEHYVRRSKLRTVVVPALCVNGDVEGQYNIYVSWAERKCKVAWKTQKPIALEMQEEMAGGPDMLEDPDEKIEDIQEEEIKDAFPHVEVLADTDVLILPATAESVDDALAEGGSVTILRRWSKYRINKKIKDGEIIEEAGKHLLEEMKKDSAVALPNKPKQSADAAGIKLEGGSKYALVYETWTQQTIGDERRLCRAFFGGEKSILSLKRNPYWSDRCPLFSVPVEKIQGACKGKSQVYPTATTQYYANDIINQAADSSMYSMMPIVMTDPAKNPRVGSMVLSLAAVWEVDPQSTQFAKFPDLWKAGFEIVASCKAQIMQTLSVSPAAITQSTQQKTKPSQADVSREQQVDILTTADAVTVIEEGVLTPLVNFMIELDHQYRDTPLMIRQFGMKGLRAKMEEIPPIQMEKRYSFRWFGVEQARTQMQLQQQIAGLNVIKSVPPDQMPGYKINLVPLITHLCENVFGPRLAPEIFVDMKAQLSLEAGMENQWLAQGIDLAVSPMDDDAEHLKEHQQLAQAGDPQANVAVHMRRHMLQMQLKQQAGLQQAIAQQMGGGSGAPQAGGGARPGAQPRAPRGGQGPAGMVGRDQIGPASGAPPALRQRGGM